MTLVSSSTFSGWFSNMGQSGVLLQNVLTIIMPFVIAGLAIWVVYHLVKAVMAKGRAETPEQRKEAWTRIWGLIAAVVFVIVGPTLILVFMNTIGKTVQNDATAKTGDGAAKASLVLNTIVNLKNNMLPYNIVNLY